MFRLTSSRLQPVHTHTYRKMYYLQCNVLRKRDVAVASTALMFSYINILWIALGISAKGQLGLTYSGLSWWPNLTLPEMSIKIRTELPNINIKQIQNFSYQDSVKNSGSKGSRIKTALEIQVQKSSSQDSVWDSGSTILESRQARNSGSKVIESRVLDIQFQQSSSHDSVRNSGSTVLESRQR